jgi:hypothetical protein
VLDEQRAAFRIGRQATRDKGLDRSRTWCVGDHVADRIRVLRWFDGSVLDVARKGVVRRDGEAVSFASRRVADSYGRMRAPPARLARAKMFALGSVESPHQVWGVDAVALGDGTSFALWRQDDSAPVATTPFGHFECRPSFTRRRGCDASATQEECSRPHTCAARQHVLRPRNPNIFERSRRRDAARVRVGPRTAARCKQRPLRGGRWPRDFLFCGL